MWPVVSVPAASQEDTTDTSEKDSPIHDSTFNKQHLSSSPSNSEELKNDKMLIDFQNKPMTPIKLVKEASTDSESSKYSFPDLETTEAYPRLMFYKVSFYFFYYLCLFIFVFNLVSCKGGKKEIRTLYKNLVFL